MPADIAALCDDLRAERQQLDAILGALTPTEWSMPTPSPGWSILDQATHLAWFDESAMLAITDPDAFCAQRDQLAGDIAAFVDHVTVSSRRLEGTAVRTWLADAGDALIAAARTADPIRRVLWYGPPMSLASSITARIMETWAHGQDIADAVGVERPPTARLRHIAFIGATAFANSYVAHGQEVPDERVRVELVAPDGDIWTFGPAGSPQRVVGPALDFCLVVTQRRHRDDTALVATGDVADEWLSIAQAFAGPAGAGRLPSGNEGSR